MNQLYPDGVEKSIVQLVPGNYIRLNELAREWTANRVFIVEEVKLRGVICSTEATADLPIYVVIARHENRARYWATWSQIAGII